MAQRYGTIKWMETLYSSLYGYSVKYNISMTTSSWLKSRRIKGFQIKTGIRIKILNESIDSESTSKNKDSNSEQE